jgi:membrane dipeptidase
MHLEGASPLQQNDEALAKLFELGVRSVGLTWNARNAAADGVGVESPRGLSTWGRDLVRELGRLGILLDVAHLAEPGFWDLIECAISPVLATHANSAQVYPHARNLSDDQIRAIRGTGGLVGVCFFPSFVDETPSIAKVIDHVDHLLEVGGSDAVAIGGDYIDFARDLIVSDMLWPSEAGKHEAPDWRFPPGLEDVSLLPNLTAAMFERGYAESKVAAILGGNALRVLQSTLPAHS